MKGAEIALVEGLRVRVGSGEACDIVLADAALPESAFELDVSAESVSFVCGEDVKTLVPFEIFEVGTSAFVIGPAEGAWEPLRNAAKGEASGATGEATSKSLPNRDGSSAREATGKSLPPSNKDEPDSTGEATSKSLRNRDGSSAREATGKSLPHSEATGKSLPPASRRRSLVGCCCALVVLLLAALAVWFFWPRIAAACPQVETLRVTCVGWFGGARDAHRSATPADPSLSLAALARQYNLQLTYPPTFQPSNSPTLQHSNIPTAPTSRPLLRGNFARRTERMAVRALALAIDPQVKLELTDDESLAAAARELLFVVTEDDLTVASATNGVVTLAGFAPSAASLERTIRALAADVQGLRNVLTSGVRVGGLPPPKRNEPRQVFADPPQTASAAQPAGEAASRRLEKKRPLRVFPIAGILTTPYRTVVLENGMRVTEGGAINGAVVDRIEPDRIVFRSGATTFEWKP